jgi:hypothetical protein
MCRRAKDGYVVRYEQLMVGMAMTSWKNTLGLADKAFSALTGEQFLREMAGFLS